MANDSEHEDAPIAAEEGVLSDDERVRDRQIFQRFLNPKTMDKTLPIVGISEIDDVYQHSIEYLTSYPKSNFDPRALYFFQPEQDLVNGPPGQYWKIDSSCVIRDENDKKIGWKKTMSYKEEPDSKWFMDEYIVRSHKLPRPLEPDELITLNRIYFFSEKTQDQAGETKNSVLGTSAQDRDTGANNSGDHGMGSQNQAGENESSEPGANLDPTSGTMLGTSEAKGKSTKDQDAENENTDPEANSEDQPSSSKGDSASGKSNTDSISGTMSGSSEARGTSIEDQDADNESTDPDANSEGQSFLSKGCSTSSKSNTETTSGTMSGSSEARGTSTDDQDAENESTDPDANSEGQLFSSKGGSTSSKSNTDSTSGTMSGSSEARGTGTEDQDSDHENTDPESNSDQDQAAANEGGIQSSTASNTDSGNGNVSVTGTDDQTDADEISDLGTSCPHQSGQDENLGSVANSVDQSSSSSGTTLGSTEAIGADCGNKSSDDSTDNPSKRAKTSSGEV